MVGSGRSLEGDKTTFFEFLRIEVRGGRTLYIAQPRGGKATELTRVAAATGDDVTFENRAHDWPKRITCRRTDTGLAVRVEGAPGARVDEFELEPMIVTQPAQ